MKKDEDLKVLIYEFIKKFSDDIPIEELYVEIDNGIVIIDGFTYSELYQGEIENVIKNNFSDIRSIKNRIVIINRDSDDDKNIALEVIYELKEDPRVDINNVHIKVWNGEITLYGTVSGYMEHIAAECAALTAKGAVNVINNLSWILSYYEIL